MDNTRVGFHCNTVYCSTVIGHDCDIFPIKQKLHKSSYNSLTFSHSDNYSTSLWILFNIKLQIAQETQLSWRNGAKMAAFYLWQCPLIFRLCAVTNSHRHQHTQKTAALDVCQLAADASKNPPNSNSGKCRSPIPAERTCLLADEIEEALSPLLRWWACRRHRIWVQMSLTFSVGNRWLEIYIQCVNAILQTIQRYIHS